jgi:hypothetical protein
MKVINRCPDCNWPLDYEPVIIYGKSIFKYYCEVCDLYFWPNELKDEKVKVRK